MSKINIQWLELENKSLRIVEKMARLIVPDLSSGTSVILFGEGQILGLRLVIVALPKLFSCDCGTPWTFLLPFLT